MTGSRVLDSNQDPLWIRPHIAPLNFVVLTTYTNRDTEAVDKVFHISNRGLHYKFGGVTDAIEFIPMLKSINQLIESMSHVPTPGGAEAFTQQYTIELHNLPDRGELIAEALMDHTLENARIQVCQLLIDRFGTQALGPALVVPHVPWRPPTLGIEDQSALAGTEHTTFWRGRVLRAVPVSIDTISLLVERELPNLATQVIKADQSDINDPLDVGLRLPIVYGKAKQIPCIGWQVGAFTTLVEGITTETEDTTILDVTTTEGFPVAGGDYDVRIDFEDLTVRTTSATTITLQAGKRGLNGTVASQHAAGSGISELVATTKIITAGHAVDGIGAVFVKSPINGELHRVVTAFTKTVSDTVTVDGVAKTVASFSFTSAQLALLYDDLYGVVEQPEDTVTIELSSVAFTSAQSTAWDNRFANAFSGTRKLFGDPNINTDEKLLFYVADVPQPDRYVKSWRMKFVGDFKPVFGSGGNFEFRFRLRGQFNGDEVFHTTRVVPKNTPDTFGEQVFTTAVVPAGRALLSTFERGSDPTDPDDDDCAGIWIDCDHNVYLDPAAGVENCEVYLEVILAPAPPTTVSAFGLRFFADCDGYEAPAGYIAATNAVMENPADIIRHWIEEIGDGQRDTVTWSKSNTNLTGYTAGFNALGLGSTWDEILARMAYEAKSNVRPVDTNSGTEWQLLNPQTDHAFDEADINGTVDEWDDFVDGGRDFRELASRFDFRYNYQPRLGNTEQALTEIVVANPAVSEVTGVTAVQIGAARDIFGERDANPVVLLTTLDETTAKGVAGYYVHEAIAHNRRVYAISGIPHYQAYKLRPGDLFKVVPDWIERRRPSLLGVDSPHTMVGEASDWTVGAGGGAVSDWYFAIPSAVFGGGSLVYISDSSTVAAFKNRYTLDEKPYDLRRRMVRVYFYAANSNPGVPPAFNNLSTVANQAFQVGLSSRDSAGLYNNYSIWGFTRSTLTADAWNKIEIDLENDTPWVTGVAGVDLSRVVSFTMGNFLLVNGTSGVIVHTSLLEIFNRPITVRVIETTKDWVTNKVNVRCVEVETS